ncbi:MAG: hypothetical protein QM770_20080 [Tepidisphaeraceae bacterium]
MRVILLTISVVLLMCLANHALRVSAVSRRLMAQQETEADLCRIEAAAEPPSNYAVAKDTPPAPTDEDLVVGADAALSEP